MKKRLLSLAAVVAFALTGCGPELEEGQDGFESSTDLDAPLIVSPPDPEMGEPVPGGTGTTTPMPTPDTTLRVDSAAQ